jgi:4-hydroxyphenylacetate 3-monooxygenase
MRTSKEYREALRDGRKVWMLGEGAIEDVTQHPATRGMVDSYALWYDRHFDPAWQDTLLTKTDGKAARVPLAYEIPQSAADLRRLGRAISAVSFITGGNMTHTPGYGALIALGILDTLKAMKLSEAEIANCATYRDAIAKTGRFLTFSAGGAPVGFRYRENEAERAAIRIVKERDDGLVISGKVAMHTSSPFADDVFVSGGTKRKADSEHFTWFIIPVAAKGVRVIARKPAARHGEAFTAPMTHRYDELDAQLWLDNVLIPNERVFTAETPLGFGRTTKDGQTRTSNLAAWLFWHQHYCWLAKLEFALGLSLAAADAMGYKSNPAAVEQLLDMVIDVQTARSCALAAELDPDRSDGGFVMPGQVHVASASLHTLKARQRLTETVRRLPGSSVVVAPALSDFADPEMAKDLEQAFGGGGYTARQRAALLNLIWDHVSSGLDGRESTYEMHSNGGVAAWRMRMRGLFKDYNRLANEVLKAIEIEMPQIDVSFLERTMGFPVAPPPSPGGAAWVKIETRTDTDAAGRWLPGSPAAGEKK